MNKGKYTILIADDEQHTREDIADALCDHPYRLIFAETAKEVLEKARAEAPDLVLLDLVFPDSRDLTPLRHVKALANAPEVIMISAQSDDLQQVVAAVKLGAFDFVAKPFNNAELLNRIEKVLHLRSLKADQRHLLKELQGVYGLDQLIGESHAMRQVRDTFHRLADFEGCVLVRGDSGTGKELAARSLHYLSRRASKPFVVVNCASIPESLTESILFGHRKGAFTGAIDAAQGKFEIAEDGTIFMDEIGDMPHRQQATLLRVLEYRKFTAVGDNRDRECRPRFIFATNRDLRQAVREGAFREDLFHRIHVATILMPALSSRPEDIPRLVEHFTARFCAEMGRNPLLIGKDVLQVLSRYDWPGNVRELRNILEASIMLMDRDERDLSMANLPPELLASRDSEGAKLSPREQREKEDIIQALRKNQGNQTQAAKALGYHRNTIRSKIRYYGISVSTG